MIPGAIDLPDTPRGDEPVRVEAADPISEIGFELIDLLTVIIGHASVIGATRPAPDGGREDAEAIGVAARRASALAARLLEIGRDG